MIYAMEELTPEGQFHSKKNIPKDQWVRTVGHHPAIIDDELLRKSLKISEHDEWIIGVLARRTKSDLPSEWNDRPHV